MVVCLEQCADLHMAQLVTLPLNVSWFGKIQIGFTFLVPAHLGSPGRRAIKRVCVCVYVCGLTMPKLLNKNLILFLKNETKNCIAYDPSSKQQMTDLRIGRDFFGFTSCQYLNMTGYLLARTDFSSPQLYIASNQLITTYNDNNHHQ